MVYLEEGKGLPQDFQDILLTLQEDLPEGNGKLIKMAENAQKAKDITITYQKDQTQSLKIESYDTTMFVNLAQNIFTTLSSWPKTSTEEASQLARSIVGGIVASLEIAGGTVGLYSAQEATVEVYEFCI